MLYQHFFRLPNYGENGFTNHLPMALIALDKMNTPLSRIERFTKHYAERLEAFSVQEGSSIKSIDEALGKKSSLAPAFIFFKNELKNKGVDKTLKEYLPILIKSPWSCAFHCLIRLSYAVTSELVPEIAMALSYWTCEYKPMNLSRKTSTNISIEELASLSKNFNTYNFKPGNISTRMNEVDIFLNKNNLTLPIPDISLEDIGSTALDLYSKTKNFTLLHGVTGTHALRTLLPYIEDKQEILNIFWYGILLALFSTGLSFDSLQDSQEKDTTLSWEEIFEKASYSDDPHTIKLVYSAWEEWKIYKIPLYLQVAADKVV